MIKKLKYGIALLLLPLIALAAEFEEGKHYSTLSLEKSAEAKVTEFFSFYCPHCYRFEPVAQALEKSLPEGVAFEKSHVNFLGGLSPQTQSNLSYAYIIAEHHGKEKAVAANIFKAIHQQNQRFTDIKDLKALMAVNGIDEAQFDAAMVSMPVIAAEKQMIDAQEKFSNIGALSGVPTFIVNDKYKLNTSAIRSQEEFNELVSYLLKK
ncbi:Periplasmic thiol:disulfide interchange protein DsbA [Pseudoalteromonas luteoviolacea B = ATCC 29581]|nr:Periplasmic thiol:disulfide interchange protein DsbA [Pseudoalteromonas luteoviolacea B = ATCC 29581]